MDKLYEIIGNKDSEFAGMVFGHFTSLELAKAGYDQMPEEFKEETKIRESNLKLNTININDKEINLTAGKSAEEIIASRDKDNYVEGYIQIHISDITDNDLESFLDIISEELVGSPLLMDVNYEVVQTTDKDKIILKVKGDVSSIIDAGDYI